MAIFRPVLFLALLQGAIVGDDPPPKNPQATYAEVAGKFRDAINGRKPELLRSTLAPKLLAKIDIEQATTFIDKFIGEHGSVLELKETGIANDGGTFKLTTVRGVAELKFKLIEEDLVGEFRLKSLPTRKEGELSPEDLQAASVDVASRLWEAFNARKPELLRSTFAANMLKELDLEKTAALLDNFRDERGEIKKFAFEDFIGDTGFYKLTTERGVTALKINITADGLISGLSYIEYPPPIPVPVRNSTSMRLPFREQWFVSAGGRTAADNHHLTRVGPDNFAVDFCIPVDDTHAFWGDGLANEDFPSFGKEILAVAPGRIVQVLDGLPDNPPGFANPVSTAGNMIVIKHAEHEFSSYAHLKHESIMVNVGDVVKAGQVIARCGNSGVSREPHLHFELDNTENATFATGFPPFFRDVDVTRDGKSESMKEYEPKKGDYVKNKP